MKKCSCVNSYSILPDLAMKCIIIDDEEYAIRHLTTYCDKIPTIKLEATFLDSFEALAFLRSNRIDLVFVDIDMPNSVLNGFEFIQAAGKSSSYILVSGHGEYALKGFDHNVVDFLNKPFGFDRFNQAIQKAEHYLGPNYRSVSEDERPYFFVRQDGKLIRILVSDISWIESTRNTVTIVCNGAVYRISHSLAEIELQLPKDQFLRVHKSYLVPVHRIFQVDREYVVVLHANDRKEIPIGESFRRSLLANLEGSILNGQKKAR